MLRKFQVKNLKELAFMVVDMQNDFIHEGGKFSSSLPLAANFPKIARNIIDPIKKLIKKFHELNIPVIYTMHIHRPDYSDASPVSIAREIGALKEDSWGAEIIAELIPHSNDYVIIKRRHSAFYCTDLEILLQGLGVKALILSGVLTNICVESTARDAQFRGLYPIVLSDCTASLNEKMHQAALSNIEIFYGAVMNSNQLTEALEKMLLH